MRGSRVRTGRHSWTKAHKKKAADESEYKCSMCVASLRNTVTHCGWSEEDPHAISFYECFPTKLNIGDVPEAAQQPFANKHVAMPSVFAMPVQVQS